MNIEYPTGEAYISGTLKNSMENGEGLRYVVFLSGCTHKCKGCHNPHTWKAQSGEKVSIESICEDIARHAGILNGITLSGGDPFFQPKAAFKIAEFAHQLGLTVWTYTGYTIEQLLQNPNESFMVLLQETDVLVDGRFELENLTDNHRYIGSTNQRILTIESNKDDINYRNWNKLQVV